MDTSAIDLVQIPFIEAVSPLTWAALSLSLFTFFLSLYLLFLKVGIDLSRRKNDRHYALRLLLCLFLVLNRVSDIIGLFLTAKMATWPRQTLLTWQHYRNQMVPVRLSGFLFFLIKIITQYCIIYIIYLLTVDRYVRVAMVLQNSKVAKLFLWIQRCLLVAVFMIIVLYLEEYVPHFILGGSLSNQYPNWKFIVDMRRVMESILVSGGILLDYSLNLCLILFATRSKQSATVHKTRPNIPPDPSQPSPSAAPNYHRVAIKMMMNFAILTSVDMAYITILILFGVKVISVADAREYDTIMSILGSWLPLRVYLLFALLDLFLKDLNPKRQKSERKERIWLNNARFRIKNTWERVQKKWHMDEESVASFSDIQMDKNLSCDSLLMTSLPTRLNDPFRDKVDAVKSGEKI